MLQGQMSAIALAALSVCTLALSLAGRPAQAAGEGPVALRLNGDGPDEETGALTFYPGRAHALEVSPDWERLAEDELQVRVLKTLPDGRSEILRETVVRSAKATFELGPMTVPPVFEFEAGAVYRRGYGLQINVTDAAAHRPVYSLGLHQGLAAKSEPRSVKATIPAGPERLLPGDETRVVYLHHYGTEAALHLRLDRKVLADQDDVRVSVQLNPGACVDELPCRLVISDAAGEELLTRDVTVGPPGKSTEFRPDVTQWPAGDYTVSVRPVLDGKAWDEGPSITYRRRDIDPDAVRVSPVAPWTLVRDPARQEIEITDFEQACGEYASGLPDGWEFEQAGDGKALVCPPGAGPEPLALRIPAGTWAVFAVPHADGCPLQVGSDPLIRQMRSDTDRAGSFVCAADLTDAPLRIFAFDPEIEARSGLAKLRLVPVTPESVRAFYEETSTPPTPLFAVDDWCEYFHGPARLKPDQFAMVVGGQAELGLRTINWSIGRSWVEYHSKLPDATLFPARPLEEAVKDFDRALAYKGRATMMNEYDPLNEVLELRERFGVAIKPWLSMNRHYGNAYGGIFASKWFLAHPEWRRWAKNGKGPEASVVSYFFPEVRQERINIFLEVAERGADGILVGACRQVPMLLYHPEMVAAFRAETGIDPQSIDASDGDEYLRWIKWRADYFTQVLRDLREQLKPVEAKLGRRMPVVVRVPSSGFLYNLAQGLDVEQWMAEGLVDQLQLDPLETWGGRGSHDVGPYVELGRRFGVPIIGGIGATWTPGAANLPCMKRALGLIEAGVDGIEIYETELLARCSHYRWVMPMFGNPQRLREFLANSNLEACHPVTATTAAYGHDNHSSWDDNRYSIFGKDARGL